MGHCRILAAFGKTKAGTLKESTASSMKGATAPGERTADPGGSIIIPTSRVSAEAGSESVKQPKAQNRRDKRQKGCWRIEGWRAEC